MKRSAVSVGVLLGCLVWATAVWAKLPSDPWVADKSASSDQALTEAQASRVASLPEAGVLKIIRQVMTDDLFLALDEYRATRHRQAAETVRDTVLPELVVGKQEVELADDTYRFVLEVSLKAYGDRTRVLATAFPLYRLPAGEAEAAAGQESVEVNVKAPAGTAVSLGRVYVEPAAGQLEPNADQIQPLPDAADRAQKLVRSFIYLLDRRLAGQSTGK